MRLVKKNNHTNNIVYFYGSEYSGSDNTALSQGCSMGNNQCGCTAGGSNSSSHTSSNYNRSCTVDNGRISRP